MDVIRFIPGQVVMDGRKNSDGDLLVIELSPLWQDGEYHFVVKNLSYPGLPYWHVNKYGLDIDGVRRVEPVVEYNAWVWMAARGDWYKCRVTEDFDTLVQLEHDIPGCGLHNANGKVPDGRAWWAGRSSIIVGGDKPPPKRKATTPVTTPVSTTGWSDDDDDESVGEHTLPPLPPLPFVPAIVVSEPQQHQTSQLPSDWRERVWQAYVTTGGDMTKLIQDYKQLYQAG